MSKERKFVRKRLSIVSLILVVTLLASVVAGCGAKPATTPPPTTSPVTSGSTESASASTGEMDLGPYTKENPLSLSIVSYSSSGNVSPQNITNNMYHDRLLERTDGAIVLEVFNDGVLATNDREVFEGLQLGNFDMGTNNTSVMTNYAEAFKVLDIPFLFNGYDHVYSFMQSEALTKVCDELEAADTGVVCLALVALGFRHIASTKGPANVPDDLKGVLMRVIESEVYIDEFNALGCSPQATASSEVLIALQQGTIDAMENTYNILMTGGYLEFCKYVSKTGHNLQFYGITMSKKSYDALPAGVQKVLRDVALEVAYDQSHDLEKTALEYEERSKTEEGVAVNEVNRDAFLSRLTDVIAKYSSLYKESYDLIIATDPAK